MKKAPVLDAVVAVTLAAYSATDNPSPQEERPVVGVVDPTSKLCVRQGGRLEPKGGVQDNEYALCHLSDDTAAEEWGYLRECGK